MEESRGYHVWLSTSTRSDFREWLSDFRQRLVIEGAQRLESAKQSKTRGGRESSRPIQAGYSISLALRRLPRSAQDAGYLPCAIFVFQTSHRRLISRSFVS